MMEDDPAGGVGPTLTYILYAGYQYLTPVLKNFNFGGIFYFGFLEGIWSCNLVAIWWLEVCYIWVEEYTPPLDKVNVISSSQFFVSWGTQNSILKSTD